VPVIIPTGAMGLQNLMDETLPSKRIAAKPASNPGRNSAADLENA
jgi:hypothetical protein